MVLETQGAEFPGVLSKVVGGFFLIDWAESVGNVGAAGALEDGNSRRAAIVKHIARIVWRGFGVLNAVAVFFMCCPRRKKSRKNVQKFRKQDEKFEKSLEKFKTIFFIISACRLPDEFCEIV